MKTDKKGIHSILDDLEDEDSRNTGKQAFSLLDDPQSGPKGDGGQHDNESPADPDGSNDDDSTVRSAEQSGGPSGEDDASGSPQGGGKLHDLVKTLSDSDKETLRKLLDS